MANLDSGVRRAGLLIFVRALQLAASCSKQSWLCPGIAMPEMSLAAQPAASGTSAREARPAMVHPRQWHPLLRFQGPSLDFVCFSSESPFAAWCKSAQRLQFWLMMKVESTLWGLHKKCCVSVQRPDDEGYLMVVVKVLFTL